MVGVQQGQTETKKLIEAEDYDHQHWNLVSLIDRMHGSQVENITGGSNFLWGYRKNSLKAKA